MYALRVFLAYKRAMLAAGHLPTAERHAARGTALDTMLRLIDMAQECDRLLPYDQRTEALYDAAIAAAV